MIYWVGRSIKMVTVKKRRLSQINILQGKPSYVIKMLYNTAICAKRPFLSVSIIHVWLH